MNVSLAHTVFHVTELDRAIAFYTALLGFELEFEYGEPEPWYASLTNGHASLHLSTMYPHRNNVGHGNVYFRVEDAEAVYQRLVKAGVSFYAPLENQPYGMRDFSAKDPDGNQVGIGSLIEGFEMES